MHVCAWLLLTSLSAAACGGEKFTASDKNSAENAAASAGKNYAPPSRGDSGTAGDDEEDSPPSSGGRAASGGTSSGGAVSTTGGTTTNAGGSTSAGGAAGSGTTEACTMGGSVKFKMVPSPDLPHDYLCDAGCGTGWLTITDADGAEAFSIFPSCGSMSCESCSLLPCAAAACLPTPLTGEGSELTWAGTYLAQAICGMNTACQQPTCAAPGKYKAKACAAVNAGNNEMAGGSCTPKDTQLCAEAEFDFPTTAEVKLVLKKQ